MVTSSIDPRQFDHKRTQGYKEPEGKTALAECPEELKASPAWTKAFLEGFAALRQRLQK